MNVSAVNCTPIKPQVSFGNDDSNYESVKRITSEINDGFVHSENIKTPIAAAGSIALAGLLAFVTGKKIASGASTLFKSLPQKFETGLKAVSRGMKGVSGKLKTEAPGKFSKVRNIASTALSKTEELAKTAYKKIAYSGIADDIAQSDRAAKAFQNVVGWASVAAAVPTLSAKDSDANGVSDLVEKNTNAYDGVSRKTETAIQGAAKLTELVEALT